MANPLIVSIEQIRSQLALAEGSGRVEFKRSCLWPSEATAAKVQGVLVRLANANVATGGLIELGREDDGTRVGLVDKDLQPITRDQMDAAEQTLVAIANRLRPPMQIRWQPVTHADGTTTVVVVVPGRAPSHWYQDERGISLTGSASHPVVANPELLRSWALEDLERLGRQQEEFRSAQALRQEYILSHDGISSGILAGTEPLPPAWELRRRRELGWDNPE